MNRRAWLRGLSGIVWAAYVPRVAIAESVDAASRQLRFGLSLTNPHDRALTDQNVWLYLPLGETPTQRLQSVEVSAPHNILHDELGHTILHLHLPRLAPFGQKLVSVKLQVATQDGERLFGLEEAQSWLSPERFVESDDSRVKTVARALSQETTRQTAQAIYEWVSENVEYAGYVADERGALSALIDRGGDCTEYADLVVALARANGIPGRVLGGFVVERDGILRPQDYHNWAELYFEGAWRLVDAQKRHWLGPTQDYVGFRIHRDLTRNPIGNGHRYRVDGSLILQWL